MNAHLFGSLRFEQLANPFLEIVIRERVRFVRKRLKLGGVALDRRQAPQPYADRPAFVAPYERAAVAFHLADHFELTRKRAAFALHLFAPLVDREAA
jgi:hypothetical protein